MKVCVDIQSAVAQPAGVGRYTRQLIRHLSLTANQHQLSLFYFDFKRVGITFDTPNATLLPMRWLPGRLVQTSWKMLNWPPFEQLAGPADVYHFPNFIAPPLRAARAVVTIHDLGFLRFPEFTEDRNCAYLSARIGNTVRRAAAIITVSRFTAQELQELLNVNPDRIFPIHSGMAETFSRPSQEKINAVLHKFGLDRPYLLSVGTIEPRKNYPFLVEIFEHLASFDGYLVIVGSLGWKYDPILERIRHSPAAQRIRLVNYADDSVLPALYAGAELLAMPSFYEGFGFPPLEAMACGTPVVSSRAGSLGEILDQAALLLDGFDREQWLHAIESVLTDSHLRQTLIAAGRQHTKRFSWIETATQTWGVYARAAAT